MKRIVLTFNYKDTNAEVNPLCQKGDYVLVELNDSVYDSFKKWEVIDEDILADLTEKMRIEQKKDLKEYGISYEVLNSEPIPFSSKDAIGMLQVKAGFELGLADTVIEFSNGTKLPIKAEEFADFAAWFVTNRNKLFV